MIHHGDCLEVMAAMEPESVDAIVTDPPYGLEFMGKAWDKLFDPRQAGGMKGGMGSLPGPTYKAGAPAQAFHARWAEAAYRVAKPSAYLLAFGGTRTVHRMTTAIEDAGWVIRDMLVWAYAQGFPKSHNVGRDDRFCQCQSQAEYDVRPMRDADVPEAEGDGSGFGSLLFEAVPKPGLSSSEVQSQEGELRSAERIVEGWRDHQEAEGELRRGASRARPGVGTADGEGGRLYPGASAGDGGVGGSFADPLGDGQSHRPQPIAQRSVEPRPLADEWGPQAWGGWPRCDRCGKPAVRGWGTALKPAWEPIVLARKPGPGPIAESVYRYGTGALNIDATRIGPVGDPGRWPPNVLLTSPIFDGGVDGVVGGGEAGGNAPASGPTWSGPSGSASRNAFDGMGDREPHFYGDSGTYSRFFLVPKASRSDREPVLTPDWFEGTGRVSTHPTVKPTELMRHLVRLVTPPGGLVLDPFLGSGTTGLAAELEGFPWIGIEKEAEYVAIAEARLNGTQRGLGLVG